MQASRSFLIGPGVCIHVIKIRCMVAYMTEERFEEINLNHEYFDTDVYLDCK